MDLPGRNAQSPQVRRAGELEFHRLVAFRRLAIDVEHLQLFLQRIGRRVPLREVAGIKVVHQRVVDPHLGLRHVLKLQAERADQAIDIGDRQLGRIALAVGGDLQPFDAKRPRAVFLPLPPDRFRRQFGFITTGGSQLLRRKGRVSQ